MGDEVTELRKEDAMPKKKSPLKVILGAVIVIGLLTFVIIRIITHFQTDTQDKFVATLAGYYLAIARGDTNTIAILTSGDFTDEARVFGLTAGRYDLFIYKIEDTDVSKPDAKKILYSISFTDGGVSLSYLNEAYISLEDHRPKLNKIVGVYRGRNVVR
jgi:hypothetical protein